MNIKNSNEDTKRRGVGVMQKSQNLRQCISQSPQGKTEDSIQKTEVRSQEAGGRRRLDV